MFPSLSRTGAPSQLPDEFDIAQICLGGHVLNYSSKSSPEFDSAHCPKCGQLGIKTCPTCQALLRGRYHVVGFIDTRPSPERGPAFCRDCGEPYPWTEAAISSAKLLAEELDMLTEEERTMLAGTVEDIVRENPGTAASSIRFKRLVAKAGNEVPGLMKDILVAFAAESARKAIWGA